MAGYVHLAKQWAIFSDEWAATLRQAPSIEYFHMVEAWAFEGEFKGWTPGQRNAKVLSLAHVIARHEPRSISIEVSRKDFRKVYEPFAPYELRDPYSACFHGLCVNLARWHAASGITVPVDFIFDEKGPIGLEALMWYEETKKLQIPEIRNLMGGPPIFRDDKKVIPLQAADLLVWHLRRSKEERFKSEQHPALKIATIKLLRATSPTRYLISRHTRGLLRSYFKAGKLTTPIADRDVRDEFIDLSPDERLLYEAVENYISSTYNNASEDQRSAVGFVMTIYRRRLASLDFHGGEFP